MISVQARGWEKIPPFSVLIHVRVAAGTSSKSARLVHDAGVRYLRTAGARTPRAAQEIAHSQAQFETGEVIALPDAFTVRVQRDPAVEDKTHLERWM